MRHRGGIMKIAKARRIERYLGNATPEELQQLLNITMALDPICGNDIYYSIVTGISFELLSSVNGVLSSKRCFYRLKEKALEQFSDYLEEKMAQSDTVD